MKTVLIVHTENQYELALQLAYNLIVSGYKAVCIQDLFKGNTGTEIREDISQIYTSTGAFIVIADQTLFEKQFHVETVHDAKRLKKLISVLVDASVPHPDWFRPDLVLNGQLSERSKNLILEKVSPYFLTQPFIVHPETARLYNLH